MDATTPTKTPQYLAHVCYTIESNTGYIEISTWLKIPLEMIDKLDPDYQADKETVKPKIDSSCFEDTRWYQLATESLCERFPKIETISVKYIDVELLDWHKEKDMADKVDSDDVILELINMLC